VHPATDPISQAGHGIRCSIATHVQPLTTPVWVILALAWIALTATVVVDPKTLVGVIRSARCKTPRR
jgi:hypothetical protein